MTYPIATNRFELIEEFHKEWWSEPNRRVGATWDGVYWRGHKIVKNPNDMLLYAMLIHKLKPGCIIETGSAYGGSGLFFHEMGRCHVLSIDIAANRVEYPQVVGLTFVGGISSTDRGIMAAIMDWMHNNHVPYAPILVSLDSDHEVNHVYDELEIYSKIAKYIVVEDTNLNGYPIAPEHGPGPHEAVEMWMKRNRDEWEEEPMMASQFLFSANTWLRRKS